MSRPRSSTSRRTRRRRRTSSSVSTNRRRSNASRTAGIANSRIPSTRMIERGKRCRRSARRVWEREVILRAVHRASRLQRQQIRQQQIVLQRIGFVEVDERARRWIDEAAIAVVPVMLDQDRPVGGQRSSELLRQRRLAAASSAGDTDEHREHARTYAISSARSRGGCEKAVGARYAKGACNPTPPGCHRRGRGCLDGREAEEEATESDRPDVAPRRPRTEADPGRLGRCRSRGARAAGRHGHSPAAPERDRHALRFLLGLSRARRGSRRARIRCTSPTSPTRRRPTSSGRSPPGAIPRRSSRWILSGAVVSDAFRSYFDQGYDIQPTHRRHQGPHSTAGARRRGPRGPAGDATGRSCARAVTSPSSRRPSNRSGTCPAWPSASDAPRPSCAERCSSTPAACSPSS